MAQEDGYLLYTVPGTGSTIVEALLTLADAPFSVRELTFEELGPGAGDLQKLNPLGQVPTLLLPDGTVMSECAAITLYLAERYPAAGLAPESNTALRSAFLRWLVFFGSPIYATFTYGDLPARWVPEGDAARTLRKSTDSHRESLWRYLEGQVSPAPWFLGDAFSALDIFIGVMTHWRPRRAWFEQHCPKLHSIAQGVDSDSRLTPIWTRNFS